MWRAFLKEHPRLALWLIAAALAVKALMPAGYMLVDTSARTLTVAICDGNGPATMTIQLPMGEHKAPDSKQDGGCAFSALSHATMGGADPVLLLAAFAFLLALGFAATPQPAPRRRAFARPPSQGPPTRA
jgi:disulfide bond formation protein DsbB